VRTEPNLIPELLPKQDRAARLNAAPPLKSSSVCRRLRSAFAVSIARLRPLVFVRRERWTVTWPARLAFALLVAVAGTLSARYVCRFLAISDPVAGQFLVVEGWLPPYAYGEAGRLFREGGYATVIAAGTRDYSSGDGDAAREYFAEGTLIRFGVPTEHIVIAGGAHQTQDRTFNAALSVRHWLESQRIRAPLIDVVTLGAHARRSRLLYEKALGEGARVGIIAVEDRQFDARHWWRSSEGVRTTIDEAVAYAYARLFSLLPSDGEAITASR
jgi:hypothetical protein